MGTGAIMSRPQASLAVTVLLRQHHDKRDRRKSTVTPWDFSRSTLSRQYEWILAVSCDRT